VKEVLTLVVASSQSVVRRRQCARVVKETARREVLQRTGVMFELWEEAGVSLAERRRVYAAIAAELRVVEEGPSDETGQIGLQALRLTRHHLLQVKADAINRINIRNTKWIKMSYSTPELVGHTVRGEH
jgi:hypothetical protein